MKHTVAPIDQKELFGQPIGLYVLFFTEMWERFSFYGMRAIFVLYLITATTGGNAGLGWTQGEALALYGWYTMLVYVMSIPGGIIGDKVFGQKKTVLIGGILLVAGHSILALEQMWAFYSGLVLIIAGVGMLKPNIVTMVGGLYKEGDIRRDKGFTIYYIGINLGAFLSSLVVGYVGEEIGWNYGFGLAGIAMAIGLLVYIKGQKYLVNVGNPLSKAKRGDGVNLRDLYNKLFKSPLQLAITSILLVFSIYWLIFESIPYGLLFIFLTLATALMLMVYKDISTQVMKDRYVVMLYSFIIVIVFWGAVEQTGGLMNIYALEKTNRAISFSLPLIGNEVPASWFQSLNPLFVILFGVFVASFWARRKLKSKEASSIFKMAVGTLIMGLGFVFMTFAALQFEANGFSAMYWLVLAYLLISLGELSSAPVAISFVTKLAPVKYASLMMGVYMAATGLGSKVAGITGEFASVAGDTSVFAGTAIFVVIFSTIVLLMLKPLKRLTHGVEDNERQLPQQENFELGNEEIIKKNGQRPSRF